MFFLRNRLPERYGAEKEKPNEAIFAEAEERALAKAREYVGRYERRALSDLIPLLEHMVANKLAGRAYIVGIDKTKSLHENARILREKG